MVELRTRPVRLPIIAGTGVSNGDCFLGAMLAHTLQVDFSTNSVPREQVQALRALEGVPGGQQYILGDAQQAVALHLGVGYIMVEPNSRKALLFTVNSQAPETLQYAMLVLQSHMHMAPLATSTGKKCGLVTHGRAMELLGRWGIEMAPRGGSLRVDE